MPKLKPKNGLETMRHSCAHVLAQAVLQMFPEAKLAIGPAIENGFYYDFDLPRTLIPEDLPLLEEKMKKIVKEKQKFVRSEVPMAKAIQFLKKIKQLYKVEMAEDLKKAGEKKLTFYENIHPKTKKGTFVDPCIGPHVKDTGEIGAFKLTKIAGAYWRGDSKNKMLQRIYGVCFPTQKELETHLKQAEEAEKRSHKKLGQDLDLFQISEEFGAGLTLWHPRGAILRKIIEDFILNEYLTRGYELVLTPHIANLNLFKTSGHWNFYRTSMYSPMKVENQYYIVKPMNCPGHVLIYRRKARSYRDLPVRYTELGTVYRFEPSGTLHGLTRVRGFTQDDAHIFCRPEQLHLELVEVIKLTKDILETFGFSDFEVALSTRDPFDKKKYLGDDRAWALSEDALAKAIEAQKWKYTRMEGEAVFYGPKMDILVKDSLERKWQITTLQVDFNLPERFNLTYTDRNGEKKRPIMLHRALLGSLERFTGLLIEHYGGVFPLWLSPVQVRILPVAKTHQKYAQAIFEKLKKAGIRVEFDRPEESLGKRIREAELLKIPYMVVVGEKEMKGKKVSVRDYRTKKQTVQSVTGFLKKIQKEIEKRK